jgi:hypothetical protein
MRFCKLRISPRSSRRKAVDQPLWSAKIAFRIAQCWLEAPKTLRQIGLFLAELLQSAARIVT